MKSLTIIATLTVFFCMQSCAQKSEKAPQEVLSAFSTKFPEATKVKWEMEKKGEWEAEFKLNGKEYSANFSVNGDWLETEYSIKESEIPANIRAILDQNFSNYEADEVEIAESPSGSSYEMGIEVGDEEFEVIIDSSGNLKKKKEVEEKDKD